MKKYFILTFLLLPIIAFAGNDKNNGNGSNNLDLGVEYRSYLKETLGVADENIIRCGNLENDNQYKVWLCHANQGSKGFVNICIDLNSLKKGHLTEVSGETRLHSHDYLGICGGNEENKISIYPCNAGMKRQNKKPAQIIVGDSTSNFGSYNDYIHADITTVDGAQDDNSYDNYNYNTISVEAGRYEYNTITNTPFTTMFDTDELSFVMHSETYGTNYYVDWCINQTIPKENNISVVMSPSSLKYTDHSELVTKYQLYCGDSSSDLSLISSSSYERISNSSYFTNIYIPPTSKCIWRQRFIETKSGIRPNSSAEVKFGAYLEIE